MAHTYSNLIYHFIFSTQGRLPSINSDQKSELHAYLAGLVNEKRGRLLVVNNMPDHLHMLVVLPPDSSPSELMKFVKANSSRWMRQRFEKPFAWQKGFGVFTVSRSGIDGVAKYIRDQEVHHKKMDYRSEFVMFLAKNDVEFDEALLWK
jgi:putative transposase